MDEIHPVSEQCDHSHVGGRERVLLTPPFTFSDFLTTKSVSDLASGPFAFFFVSLFSRFFLIFIGSFISFVLAFLGFWLLRSPSGRSTLYSRKFGVRLQETAENLRTGMARESLNRN